MRSLLRSAGAVLLGSLFAVAVTIPVVGVVGWVFGMIRGPLWQRITVEPKSISDLPIDIPVMLIAGMATGVFAGALLAARAASRPPVLHGMFVTIPFLLAGIAFMLSFATWAWILGIVACLAFLGGGYAGSKVGTSSVRRS